MRGALQCGSILMCDCHLSWRGASREEDIFFFLLGALESWPASATVAGADHSNRAIRLNVVNLN